MVPNAKIDILNINGCSFTMWPRDCCIANINQTNYAFLSQFLFSIAMSDKSELRKHLKLKSEFHCLIGEYTNIECEYLSRNWDNFWQSLKIQNAPTNEKMQRKNELDPNE